MTDKYNISRYILILLSAVTVITGILGAYYFGLVEGLGSVFFMAIGLRIISQFLKGQDIAIGVSEIRQTDSIYLRLLMLGVGIFLYSAGIFHLFHK